MIKIRKFKKGAASFYIVAISTLILVIIAASFAAVIISELARTSNDDLAQSAYDAALAGVEDAKLAYYNYKSCKEGGSVSLDSGLGCDSIIKWVEGKETPSGFDSCDMVASILGRAVEKEGENNLGVLVQEKESPDNNMQQYYTCTKITTKRDEVIDVLNGSNPSKVMKASFVDGVNAYDIKSIEIKWQKKEEVSRTEYANLKKDGIFGKDAPLPAVLSVGLVQTGGDSFSLSAFDVTKDEKTNRGTVYLVPVKGEEDAKEDNDKYIGAWDGTKNIITNKKDGKNSGFLKSNDKTTKNKPYAVYCDDSGEYACSTTIELPDPIDGKRSNETFVIVISLPYASPSTEVALSFKCDGACPGASSYDVSVDPLYTAPGASGEDEAASSTATTDGMQITIDSTGRANDLYRRVETILEPEDNSFSYPMYAIQLTGNDGDSNLKKNISPTCENDFIDASNCD